MKEHSHIEALSQRVYPRRHAPPLGVSEHGADGARAAQPTAPIPLIDNRYVPGKRVGRGRFGEIYEAVDQASRDLGLSRRVAVQLIDEKIGTDSRAAADLARAYAALRAGSHPNVVRIVDFGTHGRSLFLVMDLLDGVSVRSVIADSARNGLALEEVGPIVLAVGQALQYLHAKGLVYGELRPENVFITFDYEIKLLDVAPADPPGRTPYYAEDGGKPAARARDARDDVYGLACLTYELLCGRHPFNANSPLEALRAKLEPRPLPNLTVRQWDALSHALRRLRAERTASVGEYLDAFGLTGDERLRAAPEDDAIAAAPVPQPTARAAQPAPRREPSAANERFAAAIEPADYAPRPVARAKRSAVNGAARSTQAEPREPYEASARNGSLRSIVGLAFVASIAALAFYYYAELRDASSDTLTAVDARLRAAPKPRGTSAVETAGSPVTAADAGEAAQPADSAAAAGRAPEAQAGAASAIVSAREPPASVPPAATGTPLGSSSVAALPVRGVAIPSGAPQFVFDHPVVAVSERMSAVSIVIRRNGDSSSPASVFWWASDDTAKADEDYAELGTRVERFAAGENSRTILIPLIGDASPERTEAFFVYVGHGEGLRNHVDVLSSARIDIVDDD